MPLSPSTFKDALDSLVNILYKGYAMIVVLSIKWCDLMQQPWHPQPHILCLPGTQWMLNEWYLTPLSYPCLLWAAGESLPAGFRSAISWSRHIQRGAGSYISCWTTIGSKWAGNIWKQFILMKTPSLWHQPSPRWGGREMKANLQTPALTITEWPGERAWHQLLLAFQLQLHSPQDHIRRRGERPGFKGSLPCPQW